MTSTLIVIIAAVLLVLGWIRFSPHNIDEWHMDPADADEPGRNGSRMIGRDAPRFPGDPETILKALAEVALSEPGVRFLEGSTGEGMLTFVARTKVLGLRDYVTVKAVAEGRETKLAVISRARISQGTDGGRNRERLDRWLAELQVRLT